MRRTGKSASRRRPLPVDALVEASSTDEAFALALLEKHGPALETAREREIEGRRSGASRCRRRGRDAIGATTAVGAASRAAASGPSNEREVAREAELAARRVRSTGASYELALFDVYVGARPAGRVPRDRTRRRRVSAYRPSAPRCADRRAAPTASDPRAARARRAPVAADVRAAREGARPVGRRERLRWERRNDSRAERAEPQGCWCCFVVSVPATSVGACSVRRRSEAGQCTQGQALLGSVETVKVEPRREILWSGLSCDAAPALSPMFAEGDDLVGELFAAGPARAS